MLKIKNQYNTTETLKQHIFPLLPLSISNLLKEISPHSLIYLEEIRIRAKKPLMLIINNDDFMINSEGMLTQEEKDSYIVSKEDIIKTFHFISQYSVYSIEEELKNGYITVAGGHRVGLVGKVLLEKGRVKTLKYISGFNIRIAKEVIGAADAVVHYILNDQGKVFNTLIISAPKAGKTTLLRDIIRQLSSGIRKLNIKGQKVGLIDERSEIACCYEGIPQNDVGIRTDVLDGCPKAEGMMMLLRSMSPDVIAMDEIGKIDDVKAIEEAINAGVAVIATVHGLSLEDIKKRPSLRELIQNNFFERYIILGFSRGVGTVENILEGKSHKSIIGKGGL